MPHPHYIDASTFNQQQLTVIAAMKVGWRAYVDHAWGADELLPVSCTGHSWGMGRFAPVLNVSSSPSSLPYRKQSQNRATKVRKGALTNNDTAGEGREKSMKKNGERVFYQRIGLQAIESLDTLWLMDLKDEFFDVIHNLLETPGHSFSQDVEASVFELTIRALGGLLSAY